MAPDFRDYVRRRLPPLAVRAEREAEIIDELALQLEAAYEAALHDGASADTAMQCAAAEVPDWGALARTLNTIDGAADREPPRPPTAPSRRAPMRGFLQDLTHAGRSLRRSPGFAAAAIVTLALGLGLGAAAFSLIDGILLRPLSYPNSQQLMLIKATVPPEQRDTVELTLPDVIDVRATGAFAELAAVVPYAGTTTITDPPTRIEGFEVSPSLFDVLGVPIGRGRAFDPSDAEPGSPPVAIISHAFWNRLGAPEDIVGRPLPINEVSRTIVGVALPAFRVDLFPHVPDVFLPIGRGHALASNRGLRAFRGIARLRADGSVEQANAVLESTAARLAQQYPDTNRGRTFHVRPLQDEVVGAVRGQLWLVASLVALVLLIAAVNLAGLLLTRTVARVRDVAVRVALGASRWRMVRESMAEGLVVTSLGAALAVIVAAAALDAVRVTPGLMLPRLADVTIDRRAFAALLAAALAIASGSGLVPLFLLRHLGHTHTLRTGHETAGRPALRMRTALIVGQASFAFLLLAITALLAVNLRDVLARPLGFETRDVVTLRVAVPESRYPTREDTARFYTGILDTLRSQPGIVSAGVTSNLPLAGNTGSTLSVQGRDDVPLPLRPTVGWNWASPGYFRAMGMPLLKGRDFTADDMTRSPHVTVINETLARLHFPGDDPIGKRVYFGGYGPGGPPEWHEIVGVVGDVRHRQLEAAPDARAYDLFGQHWGRAVSLAVRTSQQPLQVAGLVRQLLAERDPRLAVFQIQTTQDLVSQAVSTRRLLLGLVTAFAMTGLAVALLGLYATLSYVVAQRTREVGVRLALGATTTAIRRQILARGLVMIAAGIAIGGAGVYLLRHVIDQQLAGMTTMNVPALAGAALALTLAGIAASLIPAQRATRINPVEALRE